MGTVVLSADILNLPESFAAKLRGKEVELRGVISAEQMITFPQSACVFS